MIGSAMFMMVLGFMLFVLSIWMIVRIWRRSALLAILTFFFWPVSIIALVSNWGDEDSDIRVPFVLMVLVGALMVFTAFRAVEEGVEEMASVVSAEELEAIRAEDPNLAAAIEQAQAEQLPDADSEEAGAATPDASTGLEVDSVAVAPVKRDPAEIEASHRAELKQAAAGLSWRLGKPEIAPATAILQLPAEFRFAPRATLTRVANLRGTPLAPDVLGWVVHRDVDLAREDAWYVQARFVPFATAIAPPERAVLADASEFAEQAAYVRRLAAVVEGRAVASPLAPTWDPTRSVATWQGADSDPQTPFGAAQVAVHVLPGGLLEYTVPDLHDAHAELGRRSAKLMASRTVAR